LVLKKKFLSQSKKDIQNLKDKMLDESFKVRETVNERKTKRGRLDKSLLLDEEDPIYSNKLRNKINGCKEWNINRFKKNKWWSEKYKDLGVDFNNLEIRKPQIQKYQKNPKICQSLYCPHCRKFVSKLYEDKILTYTEERLSPKPYTNDDFLHLTVFMGLSKFDYSSLNKMIRDDEIKWRRIRRRLNKLPIHKNPFIESVYEFELVDWTFLDNSEGSDFKKKQIKQMLLNERDKGNKVGRKFLFVHSHCITNLSIEEVKEVFKDEYFIGDKPLIKTDKDCGIFIQKFNKNKTLSQNIEKLTSYPFKDPYRYKHSFRGSDFKNGEYFEEEDLSKLVRIYQKIQKRSWRGLFRSVNHLISSDLIKYKRLFPKNHRIWEEDLFTKDLKNNQKVELERVWVVDKIGNCYTEGWNVNSFFPKGFETDIINRQRKIIGRIYFTHPQHHWLRIYKNQYENLQPIKTKVRLKVEEFYYPKEYRVLKRDEFIHFRNGIFGIQYFKDYEKGLNVGDVLKHIDFDKSLIPSSIDNPYSFFTDDMDYRWREILKWDRDRQNRYFVKKFRQNKLKNQSNKSESTVDDDFDPSSYFESLKDN